MAASLLLESISPYPNSPGGVAVFCTRQLSAGITRPNARAYRLLNFTAGDDGPDIDLTAAYTARFGALVAGKKVFIKLLPINGLGVAGLPDFQAVVIST